MNAVGVSLNIRDMFFDRAKVLDRVSADNRKRLSKAGAFIRTRARSKLGRPVSRKTPPGAPGSPPRVRSSDARATLKFILFGLDSDWESVVIGPVGLPSKRLRNSTARTVPELMELGGTAMTRRKRKRFPKHPFMGPSLNEEIAKGTIRNLWRHR